MIIISFKLIHSLCHFAPLLNLSDMIVPRLFRWQFFTLTVISPTQTVIFILQWGVMSVQFYSRQISIHTLYATDRWCYVCICNCPPFAKVSWLFDGNSYHQYYFLLSCLVSYPNNIWGFLPYFLVVFWFSFY